MAELTPATIRAAEKCWDRAMRPRAAFQTRDEMILTLAEIIEQETGHRELVATCEAAWGWLAEHEPRLTLGAAWSHWQRLMHRLKAVIAQHKADIGRPPDAVNRIHKQGRNDG